MPRSLIVVLATCALVAALALGLTLRRVAALEATELEHESRPQTLAALASANGSTRVSARLTSVMLERGEHATFEVCSADPLAPARWQDALELVVFRLSDLGLMLRVPLDAQHLAAARRGPEGACLSLGGGVIEQSGRYAVDAVWPSRPLPAPVTQIALHARVLGRTPLTPADQAHVVALFLAAALALLAWMTRADRRHAVLQLPGAPADADTAPHARLSPTVATLVCALLPLALVVALTQVPTASTAQTLLKGVLLVLVQALGPFALARLLSAPRRASPLAPLLAPIARPWRFVLASLLAAALLVVVAQLALELVPATSEAPIQTFVSWPSGLLCFAALGVLLPLGEELLFRGHLWAAALALFGRTDLAAATTYAVFVLLHLQQSWGNWGGLLAIAVTGAVLSVLRIASGSVLVPALTHVLYNFALSVGSF